MFTVNNIIITFFAAGMVGVTMITVYLSMQSNKVQNIMKQNKNVVPLLLHKSTQYKFNAIHTKLPNVPSIHQEKLSLTLEELVSNFRNETICIRKYNQGLDYVMMKLNEHC